MSGFPCPECGTSSEVTDSRPRDGYTYRRRECENRHRFTTSEAVGNPDDLKKLLFHDDVLDLRELDDGVRIALKTIYDTAPRRTNK